MKVCSNCFSDQELIGYINSLDKLGECDVCKKNNVTHILLDELQDFFQELVDNFEPDENGTPLKNKIQGNWSFFSNHKVAYSILNFILPKLKTQILSAEHKVNYINDIEENISYWETLKNELKWKKRFLTDIVHLTEDLGWDGFFNTQYQLNKDVLLFRARVHHSVNQEAYPITQMSSPPKEYVSGGRANSLGVPTLYLSDNKETVLYEVRASFLDELTIGTFNLKGTESIKIVDFTEDTPLFQPERINETIKAKLLREQISSDLSKPMRRYDSEIEYIPTQFICEFIKVFTGAKGIRFQSSLHPKGKNLVIFDQNLLQCIDAQLVKINNVELKSIPL